GNDLETKLVHRLVDFGAGRKLCHFLHAGSAEPHSQRKAGANAIGQYWRRGEGCRRRGAGDAPYAANAAAIAAAGDLAGKILIDVTNPRLALDFANLGTGILDIADSETNGVTEFPPAPAQRAADRARTNDCDFHE